MSSFGPIFATHMEKEQLFIGRDVDSNLIAKYNRSDNEIRFYIHLNRIPFRRRIIKGIMYIFGSEKNGHYKAFTLKTENKTRMINLIRKLQ